MQRPRRSARISSTLLSYAVSSLAGGLVDMFSISQQKGSRAVGRDFLIASSSLALFQPDHVNYCAPRLFWVQILYVFCLLQMTCMHLPGSRTQAVRHSDSSFSTRSLCSCKRVDIILWPNNSCASGLSVFKLDAAQCWHTRASCRVLDGTLDEVHGEKHTVASCAPSLRRNR